MAPTPRSRTSSAATSPVIAPARRAGSWWATRSATTNSTSASPAARLRRPELRTERPGRGGGARQSRFSLSFIIPTGSSAAPYFVQAHVTNVSDVPANGFGGSRDWPASDGWAPITPADDTCPTDPAVYCRPVLGRARRWSPPPSGAALEGKVTATYGAGDSAGLEVGARLVFGVDTTGQPMNPDHLSCPPWQRNGEPLRPSAGVSGLVPHVVNPTLAVALCIPNR